MTIDLGATPALSRSTLPLNSGGAIPRVGLGVYLASPRDAHAAVLYALKVGYRHIDTAQFYANEEAVGRAVRDSGLDRSQIFVTTKLWNDSQGARTAEPAFERSVEKLGIGPPDLYLLHWPVPGRRLESWHVLERLYEEKRVKSIGVSNFLVHHLEELLGVARIFPSVNQIELSPFRQQRAVCDYCFAKGIVVEAYSPLTKGHRLGHPVLKALAGELQVSTAQVMLRWSLQRGFVTLPKSVRSKRIEENIALDGFTLDPSAMARLDALEEDLAMSWDPTGVP